MRFHTNLPVKNLHDTLEFYRVLFDTEPVKIKGDYAKFLPAESDINISFHENAGGAGGLRDIHLGLEVPNRKILEKTHARLEKAGLITAKRETSVCCYANQDKFWVTDPDGFKWEIYLLLEDTEAKESRATGCCASL